MKTMQLALLIGICIFITPNINIVIASDPIFAPQYAIYPSTGTSKTNILAMIRPDKPTSGSLWLYIFWDDMIVEQRLMDPVVDGVHTYMWDVTFQPPQNPVYCKKGSHTIRFRVEDIDANVQYYQLSFEITDTVPDVSWFDTLPQEYLNKIIGPVGPKGDTGSQGIPGEDGATGAQGPAGIQGTQGIQGNLGQLGPIGPIGLNGTQGELGEDGVDGKSSPVILIYGSLGLSALSSLGVLLLFSRRRRS